MKVETRQADVAHAIERLLAVQTLDLRIRELEKELHDIPLRKEEEESRLIQHREALIAVGEKVKKAQAAIKQLEIEGDSLREKVDKLRRQQMELKTNKEFQTMESEIRAVQREMSGLEDRELVLMEDLEAARAEAAERKRALDEEEASVTRDVDAWSKRTSELDADVEGLRASRRDASQGIDLQWLRNYEKIVRRKTPALAAIQDGVCGGCHMTLAPYVLHDARRGDSMVFCDFCGRMLHWQS